ncbi:MAG TPA: AsmA-like C-terminal region-containing protein, partial [Alphaproteobacteria bacterium]|nr:AsmA-like C-terminal region-containing protein [Alphaproteobacteria bacterium]
EEKLAVSAMSLVDGALSGGQTKFDTVKGDYNIQNGLVVIQSMVMDSAEAMIESTGSADLPKWFINVDNKITLKNVTDLQPFNVKIKGPIDNPTDTFGKNILEDYIQDKIKRKVVKELPGILGDDTTKKLQQFGILPQDAPQAAPAPTTDGTAAPTTQEVAPTQQQEAPAPKKIEKPEDALDAILNGSGKPEDAVKDVLKGLF